MTVLDLSIIAPLYNEEESIRPLYKAICDAVDDLPYSAEILFVDDGSTDRTGRRFPGARGQVPPQLRPDPGDGGRH